MADSNHVRRDGNMNFSENDPFAELTRIMGHDPRTQPPAAPEVMSQPASPTPAEDDFGLDLERELAAGLDLSGFEDEWPIHEDALFDGVFAEQADHGDPSPVMDMPETFAPHLEANISETMLAGLDDVLERELFVEQPFDDLQETLPVGEAYHDEMPASYAQAPMDETAANHAGAIADVTQEGRSGDDDWAMEAEFDVDFLERELALSTAQESQFQITPPASFEAEIFSEPDDFTAEGGVVEVPQEMAAQSVQPDQPLSLEEELQLLLAGDPLPVPPVETYVQAGPETYIEAGIEAGTEAAAEAEYVAPVQSRVQQSSSVGQIFTAAPLGGYQTASLVAPATDYSATAPEQVEQVEQAELAVAAPVMEEIADIEPIIEDDIGDIFGDDFTFEFEREAGIDVAQSDSLEDSAQVLTTQQLTTSELPDIETVELAEAVTPVNDDLDIPEIDYHADVPSGIASDFHDDFQSDFGHLFSDAGVAETTTASGEASAKTFAATSAASAAFAASQEPQQASYVLEDAQWQQAQAAADYGYDPSDDLAQALAMSTYQDEPAEPVASKRRSIFVLAALGGVVLLGGAGIVGMSMLGGGSDTPAIVRADAEPMKVRPENPGGTTVPNQDNEVYQRVSGASSNAGPTQEQLISSAEEPVDVVARVVEQQTPSALSPVTGDEVSGDETEFSAPIKSEDRMERVNEATSPVEASETSMVAPRRVRTMIVRPDGTMVPREELVAPEAEGTQDVSALQQGAVADQAGALAPMGEPVPQVDELDDGPTLDMPQTVAVVPTQRSVATQQQMQQTPAPAQQVAAPVAAPVTPPAAPSAATGEWSMQIASQPTAEGAQSSYQDLARRYGSVLEGRGVNIVRADIDGRGTYYRVRIPASSRDEAIQLCTRYKAAGGSCFVSR